MNKKPVNPTMNNIVCFMKLTNLLQTLRYFAFEFYKITENIQGLPKVTVLKHYTLHYNLYYHPHYTLHYNLYYHPNYNLYQWENCMPSYR